MYFFLSILVSSILIFAFQIAFKLTSYRHDPYSISLTVRQIITYRIRF